MRYALLIYPGASVEAFARLPEEEQVAIMEEFEAIRRAPGVVVAARLHPPESATTVRSDGATTLMTDGPFANTKEILGGLCLLEAANLDVALEFAGRIPTARMGGAVEVRPVVEV
jgi:hypothetical protein